MPLLTLLRQSGERMTLPAHEGQTINEALRSAGLAVDQPCAGRGVCGKCRVFAYGSLDAPEEAECNALSTSLIEHGWRLACMARIAGDCTVQLPAQADFTQIATGKEYAAPAPNARYVHYGAAVDIGTTTICVQLYGSSGLLYTTASKNPQTVFGADVISRIASSMAGEADALRRAAVHKIEELLGECVAAQSIIASQVDALVITGNTAMLYLLTGKNPASLAGAPFLADHLFGETLLGNSVGFRTFSHVRCYLPGCIGAFIGADLVTAVLRSGMMDSERCSILVDVGTNGEIALKHRDTLYCCSTAAGPAFEGAGITHGSLGVPGSIDTVALDGNALRITTIGGKPPQSICGSGVIDVIAALLQSGAIDTTGRMDKGHVFYRIGPDGSPVLPLSETVFFTQKDIRAVQLVKASIHAGVETMLDACGIKPQEVNAFYIAGGFGAHINLQNAARVGLFPPALLSKALVVGNAALDGAVMLLQDTAWEAQLERIFAMAHPVDLATNAVFMERYIDNMGFEGCTDGV